MFRRVPLVAEIQLLGLLLSGQVEGLLQLVGGRRGLGRGQAEHGARREGGFAGPAGRREVREHGHWAQGPVGSVHLADVLLQDVDVGEGLVADGAGVNDAQRGLGAVHAHMGLQVALQGKDRKEANRV